MVVVVECGVLGVRRVAASPTALATEIREWVRTESRVARGSPARWQLENNQRYLPFWVMSRPWSQNLGESPICSFMLFVIILRDDKHRILCLQAYDARPCLSSEPLLVPEKTTLLAVGRSQYRPNFDCTSTGLLYAATHCV